MIGMELLAEVPSKQEVRRNIRRLTEKYFSQRNILPPVSYNDLADFASALIKKYGWTEEYKAFVMVCCGNAIWQPVVSSIPFNKRILLLPQCLKNSSMCRGMEDELGLLCCACGNCSISQLLSVAEDLGYVTIVSEGTTVTTKLIESGKADAIIGVGCMEVLEKMYDSVNKYSVPGIGIPLLYAGCKDTKADTEWINEEIYRYESKSDFRLLNLNYLRNRTNSVFTDEQLTCILGSCENSTEQLVRESLLSGGKRVRPLLTILAYEVFCKQVSDHDLSKLALSIECFHKASLVHDDIEDNDDTRDGKVTLHAKYGIPVAINTGDLLIGEGYRLITETSFDREIINNCIMVVAQGHRLTSMGQGMELMAMRNSKILTLDETLMVFDYKSATAFKISLLLGAIAGGADKNSMSLLEQFSHNIGIAYQIKDDMEDYLNTIGEPDLNKQSIMYSLLIEACSPGDRVLFQDAYHNGDINKILHLTEKYKIREKTEALLKKYITQTKECLQSFTNPGLKLPLNEIMGKIFKDHI
jgi:geranylgeranyl pyrophosphate synthase